MNAFFDDSPRLARVLALKLSNKLVMVELEQLCRVHVVHNRKVAVVLILVVSRATRATNERKCNAIRRKTNQPLKDKGEIGEAQPEDIVCVQDQRVH